MRDYSYQEMLKMQEEAAARVREMQKRATLAMEEAEPPEPKKKSIPIPDEVRHIAYPAEIEMPKREPEPSRQTEEKKAGIVEYLKNDKDASLVLPLALLLNQEGNDYLTSLALLYLLL